MPGELYFLERYLFFVCKQPTLIDLADIHQVVFSRYVLYGAYLKALSYSPNSVGGAIASARTFDLKIEQKTGPEITFSSIAKEEHEGIESFLKAKKVRVTNEMADGDTIMAAADDTDDESDDESEGEKPKKARLGGDDDEDSEEGEVQDTSIRVALILLLQMRISRHLPPTKVHRLNHLVKRAVVLNQHLMPAVTKRFAERPLR